MMENWVIRPEFVRKSPSDNEKLLSSFSGLEYCSIISNMSWPLDLDTLLRYHKTMGTLMLSFGEKDFNMSMLNKIHTLCPYTSFLGFRHRVFQLPSKQGAFEDNLCDVTGYRRAGFDT